MKLAKICFLVTNENMRLCLCMCIHNILIMWFDPLLQIRYHHYMYVGVCKKNLSQRTTLCRPKPKKTLCGPGW